MEPYQELEQAFAAWAGVSNPVACSSGSAALHLALEALRLPAGGEVIVPEFTMIACARAVTLAGLTPVFVDCDERLLMDVRKIREKITNKTVAIMPVHIYGRLCSMTLVQDVARDHNLYVIEDCAEAHGATHGQRSDAMCWSFYKNKIVAGEEGGLVAFRDPAAALRAMCLRSHGFTAGHTFVHNPRGMNYRMSNAHARLVLDSLDRATANILARRHIVDEYDRRIPDKYRTRARNANWVYDLHIPGLKEGDVERIVGGLRMAGIEARCGFKPMSMQPEYRHVGYRELQAYRMALEVMYLPIDPGLVRVTSHPAAVIGALLEALEQR